MGRVITMAPAQLGPVRSGPVRSGPAPRGAVVKRMLALLEQAARFGRPWSCFRNWH